MSKPTLTDAQGRALRLLEQEHSILPGSWVFHHELTALPPESKRAMAILTGADLVERFGGSARVKMTAFELYAAWKLRVWAEGDLTNEQGATS